MTRFVPLFDALSTSSRMADLPDDTCRMFYLWMLAKCDSWGRLDARPRKLNASVWPLLKRSDDETARVLQVLSGTGLVDVYWPPGDDPFIQVPDWEDKAGSIGRKSHRTASRHPDPEDVSNCKLPGEPGIYGHLRASPGGAGILGHASSPLLSSPLSEDGVQGEAGRPKPAKASKPETTPAHGEVSAYWCQVFEAKRGSAYVFGGWRGGKAVNEALDAAKGDAAEVKRRIDRAFADPWWLSKLTLPKFASHWNDFAPTPLEVEAAKAAERERAERAQMLRERAAIVEQRLPEMRAGTPQGLIWIQDWRQDGQSDEDVIRNLEQQLKARQSA